MTESRRFETEDKLPWLNTLLPGRVLPFPSAGNPWRFDSLEALEAKVRCVCELTELVGADQSTVSKHLAVLRQAGLVDDHKEGVMVYYRVKVCCLQGFWDCIEGVLAQNLKMQQVAMR